MLAGGRQRVGHGGIATSFVVVLQACDAAAGAEVDGVLLSSVGECVSHDDVCARYGGDDF